VSDGAIACPRQSARIGLFAKTYTRLERKAFASLQLVRLRALARQYAYLEFARANT
jgi:hypothetical protein